MNELKPCPYCRGRMHNVVIHTDYDKNGNYVGMYAACNMCAESSLLVALGPDEWCGSGCQKCKVCQKVIEEWNTRKPEEDKC